MLARTARVNCHLNQVCIPEEGKLLPCHKRVGHQTWELGSHQAQAGQGMGQVVAG